MTVLMVMGWMGFAAGAIGVVCATSAAIGCFRAEPSSSSAAVRASGLAAFSCLPIHAFASSAWY